MTKRNLRKWAEAKQRREAQPAPSRGRQVYFNDGAGIFMEDPWPPFGTYCAPTTFLPPCTEPPTPRLSRTWRDRVWNRSARTAEVMDTPLFPKGAGEVLHAILHPEFPPGPPYTHTFRLPPTEYDEEGEPLWQPIEPSITIVRVAQEPMPAWAYRPSTLRVQPGRSLHLLLDHDVDRCLR